MITDDDEILIELRKIQKNKENWKANIDNKSIFEKSV